MSVDEEYRANSEALLREPDNPQALVEMFALLSDNGRQENAEAYLVLARRAYLHAPDHPLAVFNYGSGLHRAGRFRDAARMYRRVLEINEPGWEARAQYHLGLSLRCLGLWDEALKCYERVLELEPEPHIRVDHALCTMGAGRLNEGFRLFEARRELAELKATTGIAGPSTQSRLPVGVRHWKGEDLKGKTITVYQEEGIGDFFMVCRWLPRLRDLGASKVYLTGRAPDVLELVSDNIEIDGIVPLKGPIKTDFVVGSATVPWRTGVEYSDVSGKPYFRATAAKIPRRGKLNVGLVWRGNPHYSKDHIRSMPFKGYAPLFDLPNVAFHSLQVGEPAKEVTALGFDGFVADLAVFIKDWRTTASLVSALDVVVTVDTAVAHLAGALGKPVYVLVTNACDWRWPLDSERTCWYDSARIIRQLKQDEWAPCVMRVREELKKTVATALAA